MGQPGFFDVLSRYEGLDRAGDRLVSIAAAVPFEMFRGKLKKALVKGGLRKRRLRERVLRTASHGMKY